MDAGGVCGNRAAYARAAGTTHRTGCRLPAAMPRSAAVQPPLPAELPSLRPRQGEPCHQEPPLCHEEFPSRRCELSFSVPATKRFPCPQVKCARIVRVDCAAGLHRVEKACCEAQAPPCRELLVEQCESLGHPLVRQCCAVPVCGVCRVLEAADKKRGAAEAKFTKKVEKLMIELAGGFPLLPHSSLGRNVAGSTCILSLNLPIYAS